MIYGNNFIGFQFNASSLLINKVLTGNADYYIEIKDTLFLELVNPELEDTINSFITPDQVKEPTRNKMVLSDADKDEIIQSQGGSVTWLTLHTGRIIYD